MGGIKDKMNNKTGGLTDAARIAISFSLSIAVAVVCLFFIYPTVENNDDSIIHIATAGVYGEAADYVSLENPLLTRIYSAVQRLLPSVNLINATEYFFVAAAFCFVSAAIWLARPDKIGFSLSMVITFAVAPYIYDRLHYTKYAIIVGATGVLLCYLSTRKRIRPLFLSAAFVFCAYSLCMRTVSFLCGAAIVGAVCLLNMIFESGRAFIKDNKKTVTAFISLGIFVAALFAAGEIMWRTNTEAAASREYNDVRCTLSDYYLPEYSENREEYAALGVSENDVAVIADWAFGDTEIYSAEYLAEIAKLPNPRGFADWISQFGQSVAVIDSASVSFYVSAVMLALCFLLCEKKGRIIGVLAFALYYVLVFALCVYGRTTRWVETGMLTALCFALCIPLIFDKKIISEKTEKLVATALIAASVLFAGIYNYPKIAKGDWFASRGYCGVYDRLTQEEENLYICDLASMPNVERGFRTFERIPENYLKNIYFLGGWDTGSSVRNSVLVRYSVSSPYAALVEKDNVFLVDDREYESKAQVVREHISDTARYSLYDTIDGRYIIAFADNIDGAVSHDAISITEIDAQLHEVNSGFVNITVTAKTETDYDAAYITLTNTVNGTQKTYRARVLYNQAGESGFSVAPQIFDIYGDSYDMTLILKTADGSFCCSSDSNGFKYMD